MTGAESPKGFPPTKMPTSINFLGINGYSEIVQWLKSLETRLEFVRLHNVGKTSEARDILVVEINPRVVHQPKKIIPNKEVFSSKTPAIFIDAGTHGREQITVTVALATLAKITAAVQEDPSSEYARFTWYIAPLINPDGYEYSRNSIKGRMWRKNRSNGTNGCVGVDINRNWDYMWGIPKARKADRSSEKSTSSVSWFFNSLFNPRNTVRQVSLLNPCSELFAGKAPFSEMESKALSSFLLKIRSTSDTQLESCMSLHSMQLNQQLLFPYGYTSGRIPDFDILNILAEKMAAGMYNATGRVHEHGSIVETMYQTTGVQADWLYSVLGVNRTFVVEMRDNLRKIPSELIPAALAEFWSALSVLMADITKTDHST